MPYLIMFLVNEVIHLPLHDFLHCKDNKETKDYMLCNARKYKNDFVLCKFHEMRKPRNVPTRMRQSR